MNAIIPVAPRQIGENAVQATNARDLHAFLEVGKDFSTWIKDRVEKYGFSEGQDFAVFDSPEMGNQTGRGGDRRSKEYVLTLDMAKELAMVERNDKGKQARQYFIECERRAKAAAQRDPLEVLNDPAAMRGLLLGYSEKVLKLQHQVEELAPKAAALDLISASEEALTFTQAAKELGVKREALTTWLHANGWIYRQNGSWVAYDRQIRNGRLQFKEARYTDDDTGQERHRPYCHVLPKGMALLAQHFATKREA